MTFRLLAAVVTTTILLTQPVLLRAQDTPELRAWSTVQAIHPGTDLSVEMKNGETIDGRLTSVSEATLTIFRKNTNADFDRAIIRRVYRKSGGTHAKAAAIGAGIGGAAGLGVGLVFYLPNKDDLVGSVVPVFGAIGAGIGAGVGALVGGKRKRVLVYEAR